MVIVDHLLGELLLRHNCVIVPAFGGFVAREVSARIDYTSGKMTPPSKSLLFNKQLINNDGLLITELSRHQNISYDQAAAEIKGLVSDWNTRLKQGGRIELDKIGTIYLDTERNLCFEQDRFFNLLLGSFGLGQVHFVSEEDVTIIEREIEEQELVREETQTEVKETKIIPLQIVKENQEEIKVITTQKKRSSVLKYIAAACILPIAFYSVWIPMKTDVLESGVISIQDFNPFNQAPSAQYSTKELNLPEYNEEESFTLEDQVSALETGVTTYTYAFVPGINLSVELETQTVGEEIADEKITTPESSIEMFSMHYIVGCFSQEENADNLVAKLQSLGFNAHVVDFHNGLHRVSAGGAMSIEGLNQIRSSAEANGFNGWILK